MIVGFKVINKEGKSVYDSPSFNFCFQYREAHANEELTIRPVKAKF